MIRSTVKELFTGEKLNEEVLLKGWARTRRGNKKVAFIAINDGTTIHNMQVVADEGKARGVARERAKCGDPC
jgi:asparaginyl-tRNA synthetase